MVQFTLSRPGDKKQAFTFKRDIKMAHISLTSDAYSYNALYEISCRECSLFSMLVSVDLDFDLRRGLFGR
jgi:hypothetical protein